MDRIIPIGIFFAAGLALLSGCVYQNDLVPQKDQMPTYKNVAVKDKNGQWVVLTPQCPQPYNQKGDLDLSKNWGCPNTRNLGMMIANPEDLTGHPRAPQHFIAEPLGDAVQDVQDGKAGNLAANSKQNMSLTLPLPTNYSSMAGETNGDTAN